jgi:protein TonB
MLVKQVPPVYPPEARAEHLQGSVVLSAIIGLDGHLRNVRSVSGAPLLIPAAIDAVKQWEYRPYYSGGIASEVQTLVVVQFSLADETKQ